MILQDVLINLEDCVETQIIYAETLGGKFTPEGEAILVDPDDNPVVPDGFGEFADVGLAIQWMDTWDYMDAKAAALEVIDYVNDLLEDEE